MLDKIKQMFGITETETKTQALQPEDQAEGKQAEDVPLTQDEYAKAVLRRLQEEANAEAMRFKEEIESMVNKASLQTQPYPQPQTQQEAYGDGKGSKAETGETLPENPTVEDLLNYVNQMVERRVEERLKQVMAQMPKIPASGIVDSLVAKHPVLQTVAEEAKQIFETLPREYQNEQTADFILWWLKGKRSEAEKKEALSELLGVNSHSQSAGNITLPYTSEQIREWAEAMGIDPKRLRQRLIETISK